MNITNPEEQKIVILFGRTAAGKSTIANHLIQTLGADNIAMFETYTTRKPRGEGEEYKFISVEEFKRLAKQDFFLEHVEFGGNLYGTTKPQHPNTIMCLNFEGIKKVYEIYKNKATKIFTILVHISGQTSRERAILRHLKNGGEVTQDFLAKLESRISDENIEIDLFNAEFKPNITIDVDNLKGNDVSDLKRQILQIFGTHIHEIQEF